MEPPTELPAEWVRLSEVAALCRRENLQETIDVLPEDGGFPVNDPLNQSIELK